MTHEADYAIRVVYYLASSGERMNAKDIADKAGVTQRFTLKILRKLMQAGIVESYKGIHGGYDLQKPANAISLGEIIEIIDGPIAINHCLNNEFSCTRLSSKQNCGFHRAFDVINATLRRELYTKTIDQFVVD